MTDISARLWDGTINCIITHGSTTIYVSLTKSLTTAELTETKQLRVHRNSYFPLYFPQISILLQCETQWLEYEDVALSWNKPIGVLYDLMQGTTPWKLRACQGEYPDYILPLMDLEQYWLNQLKESSYIQNGNAKSVMNLSKADSEQLWLGVREHDHHTWLEVYRKLKLQLKRVPVRAYLNEKKMDKVMEQRDQTLKDAISEILPDMPVKVIIHGVEPPLNGRIGELFQECVYIDGFLHITLIPL